MHGHAKHQESGYLWGKKEGKEFGDGKGDIQWM